MDFDRSQQEAKALHAAAAWAQRQVFAPKQPGELISKVELELAEYGRLFTRVERREPVWREVPYRGRATLGAPTLREADLRPWEQSEKDIERDTRHIALCGACGGERRVACQPCGGDGRLACRTCRATGTRPSADGKRKVACPTCRGAGSVDCPTCVGGRVECQACEGAGRFERWMEVTYAQRVVVDPIPPSRFGSGHPGFDAPVPVVPDWEGASREGLVQARGRLTDEQVLSVVPDVTWLEAKRAADRTRHAHFDRVVEQTLTVYAAPIGRVEFDFSGTLGHVTLVGWEPRPTDDCDDAPFRSRQRWVRGAAWTAVGAWAVGSAAHLLRDPFYRDLSAVGWSAGLAVALAGMGLGVASWRRRVCSTRRRNPFGPGDALGPALMALGTAALVAIFALVRPSAGAALDLVAQRDLAGAQAHVEALLRAGVRGGDLDRAVAALGLARAEGRDNRAAVALLREFANAMAEPAPLEAELERLRRAWFEDALERGDVDEAGRELAILQAEHASAQDLNDLAERLTAKRLALAAARLDARDPKAALALVGGLEDEDARVREVTVQAHQVAATACGSDVACAARALDQAIAIDPRPGSKERLEALIAASVQAAEAWKAVTGSASEQLAAIRAAEARLGELEAAFGARFDAAPHREAIAARRAELLQDRRPLGAELLVAEEALRWAGVGTVGRQGDQLTVEGIPDAQGVRAHFAAVRGVVVGMLLVSERRETLGLSEAGVRAALQGLLGASLPAGAFRSPGRGIKHVKTRVGRTPALMGWEDGSLVEVVVGEVTP